jgi:uncharacterized membrane protein
MTPDPARRGRFGLPMTLLAAAGAAIATCLTWQHVAGAIPPCGPVLGCETVLTSTYAEIAGIPVALPGALASLVILGGALAWWLRADRRGLIVAYLTGLVSLAVLGYLTTLELFVIGALCAWCVTYALVTLTGWALALLAYRTA